MCVSVEAFRAPVSGAGSMVRYPSDFEEQMRDIFGSPQVCPLPRLFSSASFSFDVFKGVLMESLEGPDLMEGLGAADSLYKLTLPSKQAVGWMAKRGGIISFLIFPPFIAILFTLSLADFVLYDNEMKLLKTIRGKWLERADAVVTELGSIARTNVVSEPELTLKCTICELQVPVSQVEKHAKHCAISFPVQIIRFEHSSGEQEQVKKPPTASSPPVPVISRLEDFPVTVLNALDKSGVTRDVYCAHLDVLVNVLNFASKMRFKISDNVQSPLRDAARRALETLATGDETACSEAISTLGKAILKDGGPREAQLARNAAKLAEEASLLVRNRQREAAVNISPTKVGSGAVEAGFSLLRFFLFFSYLVGRQRVSGYSPLKKKSFKKLPSFLMR